MISVHFQGKPFNITVTQGCPPTTDAEEAERFYEDLQDILELIPKKDVVHHRGLECKSRKSRDTWSIGQIWPWSTKLSRERLTVLPREHTGHSIHHLPKTEQMSLYMEITKWPIPKSD